MAEAPCFGLLRGDIEGRFDANYWRLTPVVDHRFANPLYPVEPIGRLLTLVQYGISSLAHTPPIGVPILRMSNLQDDGWDLTDLKYINLTEKELDSYRIEPGDILFNRTNSKELVGKCEVFREMGDWVFASYLIRVRTNDSRLLPQFASDFLSTAIGRMQIDRYSRQIIGMTNINAEEIRELLIPLPSIKIQRQLVASMDTARAERAKKLQEIDDLFNTLNGSFLDALSLDSPDTGRSSVYAITKQGLGNRIDAFSNQSRFRNLISMLVSGKHPVSTLGKLAAAIFSGSTPLSKGVAYVPPPSGVRFIRSGEITGDGRVTADSEVHIREDMHDGPLKRSQLQRGDLLIAIVGATIGAAGVYERDEPANINQAIAAVRLPREVIRPDYAWLYLRSNIGQALLDYYKRPVARANINLEEIANIPIVVPPLKIQDKLVEQANLRRAEAESQRKQVNLTWQTAKRRFEELLLGAAGQ